MRPARAAVSLLLQSRFPLQSFACSQPAIYPHRVCRNIDRKDEFWGSPSPLHLLADVTGMARRYPWIVRRPIRKRSTRDGTDDGLQILEAAPGRATARGGVAAPEAGAAGGSRASRWSDVGHFLGDQAFRRPAAEVVEDFVDTGHPSRDGRPAGVGRQARGVSGVRGRVPSSRARRRGRPGGCGRGGRAS